MTEARKSVYSGVPGTATCPKCGSIQSGGLNSCAKCGSPLPIAAASNIGPGTIIDGKYEVIGLLGVGGMGEVFKARHIHLNAFRCIKVMKRNLVADESFRNRFLREARVATHVHHPNLAIVHDFSSLEDGSYYMVSEFVDGITVRQWAARYGVFPLDLGVEIIVQVLSGLEHCHRKGLLHRDISADNVMIEFDADGHPQAKIIDLGIAKMVSAAASDATQVGLFVGNPKYSSPEQLGHLPEGEEIDGRTDLYSLGVVFYEMLTGVPPFSSKTPHGYVIKHLTQPPTPLRDSNPAVDTPSGLEGIIFKALEKDRKNRYHDARAFASALRSYAPEQPVRWFAPAGSELGISQVDTQTQISTDAALRLGTPRPSSMPRPNQSDVAPTVSDAQLFAPQRTPAESAAERARKDDEEYAKAETIGNIDAYRSYLQVYPNGRSVRMAEVRIEELTILTRIDEMERRNQLGELESLVAAHAADTKIGKVARSARSRVRERIAREAKEEQADWDLAFQRGSQQAYEAFLERYPQTDRLEEAQSHLAEATAFEDALREGAESRWKEYLVEFPEGRHRQEAESKLHEAMKRGRVESAFAHADAVDTAAAFREFLAGFSGTQREPEARQRLAEREAFDKAITTNSEDGWEDYLSDWQHDRHAEIARKNLATLREREEQAYKVAMEKGSSKALQVFVKDFPRSKKRAAADQLLAEITAFEQAAKAGAKGWETFLRTYPVGPYAEKARASLETLLEKEVFDRAARENKIEHWREYLAKHSHSPRASEAAARLEELAYRQVLDSKDVKSAEAFLDEFPASARGTEVSRLKEQWTRDKSMREALAGLDRGDEKLAKALLPSLSDPSHKRQIESAIEALHDRQDWATASKNVTADSMHAYLNAHPSGQWAAIAQTNLDEFSLLDQIPQLDAANQIEALEKLAKAYASDNRVGKAAREASAKVRKRIAKQRPAAVVSATAGAEAIAQPAVQEGGGKRALLLFGGIGLVVIVVIAFVLSQGKEQAEPTAVAPVTATVPEVKPPAGSGILIIDALPWGEVTSVKDSTGREWLTETERFTPLAMTIPPGKYTIAISNSNFPRRPLALTAEVRNGEVANSLGEFQEVDVTAFFQKAGFK